MKKKKSSFLSKNKKNKAQTAKWGVINIAKKDKKHIKKEKEISGLKIGLAIFIPILVILVLSSSGVLAYNKIYENKIYPGIKIASNNVGGLTVDEAKSLLDQKIKNYKQDNVSLSAPNNKEEWKPTLAELGFSADTKNSALTAYNLGRNSGFFANLKSKLESFFTGNSLPINYKIDKKILINYLNQIGQKIDKPATNATLTFEGTELKTISSKNGLIIDKEELEKKLGDTLKFLEKKNVHITLKTDEAKIKEKDIVSAREKALSMVSGPITFTHDDQSYTADQAQIASWIVFIPVQDEANSSNDNSLINVPGQKKWQLKVDIDENKVRDYLQSIGEEINTEPKNTKVSFSNGQKFVLEQGYDGKSLDMDNAVAQIKDQFNQKGDNRQITLSVKVIPAGEVEATQYGIVPITNEKYVDVSLSAQVLTCFDGGKAQFMSLVSTGISKYPTPAGTFHIYSKTPSTRMRHEYGPDHPDNYDLPDVPYAMFFSGPYSLHGTYWHSNFGTPMSHGCVNLPTPAAAQVYDWAPVGTMVHVHW